MKKKPRRPKGTGKLYKVNGIYYFEYKIQGKRKKVSLRTRNNQEAEKKADDLIPLLQSITKEEVVAHVAVARRLAKPEVKVELVDLGDRYVQSPIRPDSGEYTLRLYKSKLDAFIEWGQDEHPRIRDINSVDEMVRGKL